MARGGRRDSDESLAVRAAWLHYAGGMTQSEVARRLGVSSVKAHRLVASANQSGAVRVTIDGPVAECVALEARLVADYALVRCEVVPDINEGPLPLRALGIAGARFIEREIELHEGGVIGIGNGRTIAAAVAEMPRMDAGGVRFVSLLGGLNRNFAANPHDVMHRLAERTGATAYVIPVPMFANSVEDRAVLVNQRGVGEVLDLAAGADVMIAGIGTADAGAQLVAAQVVELGEMEDVAARGGVGELLGHFFDRDGHLVANPLSARTVGPDTARLRERRIVAVAGGAAKVEGIRAVLRSGWLRGLITDERTAEALVGEGPTTTGRGKGRNGWTNEPAR